MSEQPGRRQRRADAERSIAAILDAALEVLAERPDANMTEIANAAGVSRQTVYTHYTSREALLRAVQDRAIADTLAAFEAAELGTGPPAEALDRLVAAGWQTLERQPLLMDLRLTPTAEEQYELHRPILEQLERLIRRGKRAGVIDRRQPTGWLLATFIALSHAAAEEAHAGRLSPDAALAALRRTIARVFCTPADGD